MADAHSIARREMAKEKARIQRKKKEQLSFWEQEVLKWKRQKEAGQRKKEEERDSQVDKPISLQKVSIPFKSEEKKEVEPTGWAQYDPWKKEREERKTRQVSTATIWCFAKKMIAKEWARARGTKIRDSRLYLLEQQAAQWKGKKDEEEKRKEEENKRIQKQKHLLERVVRVSGEELLKRKRELSPQLTARFFEDSLEDVGEIIDVNLSGNKCDVWIEPWEEKRLRNSQRRGRPPIVTYKVTAKINNGKVSGKIAVLELSKPLRQKINQRGGK